MKVIAISFIMWYYMSNKRENGMTTMIETVVHFVSFSAGVSFSLEKRLFLRLFVVNTYKIRQGIPCQQADSFIVPHIRPERLGKREETER